MAKSLVGIVVGSSSDLSVMKETEELLKHLGVPYEITISSAHRKPAATAAYAKKAFSRGIKVIIAGAGASAHLPGAIASRTIIPVIGVPLDATPLGGLESFYSILQMPSGVPVATVAIGKSGARNSAILAAQILALKYPKIREKLRRYKKNLAGKTGNKCAS